MASRTAAELDAGMAAVRAAPRDDGVVRLVVRRPGSGVREILEEASLDEDLGVVGDDWVNRAGLRSTAPHRYAQLTLMNARYTELIAGGSSPAAWAQAGDQLYVDMDLSQQNLPAGTRLSIGTALIEISAEPHTGCALFSARFGSDALRKANSEEGRALRLRGANARIVRSGIVRPGDLARKA